MHSISRRNMLAATAAGGLLTASAAAAQTVEGIPQPGVRVTAAPIRVHAT
jgi:hypothetical protein